MALTLICVIATTNYLYGQSTAPDELTLKWHESQRGKIQDVVLSRLQQKPEFLADYLFSDPDYRLYIPKVEPWVLGDMYNDHILVFDTPRNDKLFAVWVQASIEAALDQHTAFSRSFDRGRTWETPRVIAGNSTIREGLDNNGAIGSCAFPLVSKSGRIYIIYSQHIEGKISNDNQHTGVMMGMYSDDDGDTWSEAEEIPAVPRSIYDHPDPAIPAEWVVWQKPLRQGKNGNYLVGVSRMPGRDYRKNVENLRTVTEVIHFDNIDADPPIKDLTLRWVQGNENALIWRDDFEGKRIGHICWELSTVMLPDGRLFGVMRTGGGHPVWTQSKDHGETWSQPRPLLMKDGGKPIPHPVSPCPIYDAKGNEAASGLYFVFAHNKFDFNKRNPWQTRGPLYLFAGRFQAGAEQPVWFEMNPEPFIDRPSGNSFYTSVTVIDGKTVLWYNDQKFYVLGKVIGDEYFKRQTPHFVSE